MCAEEKEASALKHPRDREMELLLSLTSLYSSTINFWKEQKKQLIRNTVIIMSTSRITGPIRCAWSVNTGYIPRTHSLWNCQPAVIVQYPDESQAWNRRKTEVQFWNMEWYNLWCEADHQQANRLNESNWS
jgi:hypothetical protein